MPRYIWNSHRTAYRLCTLLVGLATTWNYLGIYCKILQKNLFEKLKISNLVAKPKLWIKWLDVEHIEIGQRKRRASILMASNYENPTFAVSPEDLQRLQVEW